MKKAVAYIKKNSRSALRRAQAFLLVFCIGLTTLNIGVFASFAADDVQFELGENGSVKAVLSGECLTIMGSGNINDYSLENPSPLLEYSSQIKEVVIGDGITHIGSYLFYNCGELKGKLVLPKSIISIGDGAFLGDSFENAPKFTYIINSFVSQDMVLNKEQPTESTENKEQTTESTENKEQPTESTENKEQPHYDIETISQQSIGQYIFYNGQTGVFECSEENVSFITEMTAFGYHKVLEYATISVDNGKAECTDFAAPVTDNGIFMPDFKDTGLALPKDAEKEYSFTGWSEKTQQVCENTTDGISTQESPLIKAQDFYTGKENSFVAQYDTSFYKLVNQTISAQTENGQIVEINGKLPKNAQVSAVPITAEKAMSMAGEYIQTSQSVIIALDITILVGDTHFQPSDYGENVRVSIKNIKKEQKEGQSLAVLHVKEDTENTTVNIIDGIDEKVKEVSFKADSFSVYIVTMASTYSLTFSAGDYTLKDSLGSDFTDENTATDDIDVSSEGAFFRFKLEPAAGKSIVGVSTSKASDGVSSAILYGPDSNGIYTISNINSSTGNQVITVTTAQNCTLTYNVNGGVSASQTYAKNGTIGESVVVAYPADIAFSSQANYHFKGWNTSADGSGTEYKAGSTLTLSADTVLYAIWTNTATPFTAKLFNYGNYSGTNYVELTEGGAEAALWDYNYPARYLVIDADFTSGKGGTIDIILPVGMALYSDSYTQAGTNIESVSFQKLTGLQGSGGQGMGTYSNALTGTLTYTFPVGVSSTEHLIIPVTFDQNVWDKQGTNGSFVKDGAAITVRMSTGETVYEKTISKAQAKINYNTSGIVIYAAYHPKEVLMDKDTSMSFTDVRNMQTAKKIIVEYILPNDGNGNYAEYVSEDTQKATGNKTIDSSDPTKVVYTWENYYNVGFLFLAPVVKFPSSKFSDEKALTFTVKLKLVSHSGSVVERTQVLNTKTVAEKASVELTTAYAQTAYSGYSQAAENNLGIFQIANKGYKDSDKVSVVLDFDTDVVAGERNKADISAFNVPNILNTTFDVKCTLVDRYNSNEFIQTVSCTTGTANYLGAMLTSTRVAQEAGKTDINGWFLKRIEYEIASIPKNTTLYHSSSSRSFNTSGNIYGKLTGNDSSTFLFTFKVWDSVNSKWGDATAKNCVASSSNSPITTTYLPVGNIVLNGGTAGSSVTVSAGSNISLKTTLTMHTYPYGNTQYSPNPVLYFIAPKGVTLTNDNIRAVWSDGNGKAITTSLSQRPYAATGETIYKITFNGTAAFGGPVMSGIKIVANTPFPVVTMVLDTSASMETTSILLKNKLMVTDENANVSVGFRSLDVEDTYDVNENGSVTDRVGTCEQVSGINIQITPNAHQLTFSAQAKLHSESAALYRSDEANPIYLSNVNDPLDYRLTLSASNGLVAKEDFYYYIPVPKAGISMHEHMLANSQIPTFGMKLTGPVSITGSNPHIYEIRYSIDATKTNYSNGKASFDSDGGFAQYHTAEEISAMNGNSGAWESVTMMKLVAISESVPNGTVDNFDFTLAYDNEQSTISLNAGSKTAWASCGYQKYSDDDSASGVHTPTKFVYVVLKHKQTEEVIVTAAMTSPEGTSKTAIVTIPAFQAAKNLQVSEVRTENVVLKSTSEITAMSSTASTSVANGTYGITAQLGSSAAELSTGNADMGSTTAGVEGSITFTLSNCDHLSDITTIRKVFVTLVSGNDVEITITVNIARIATPVTNPVSAIDGGKSYKLLYGESGVTITKNSAVTAQFVCDNLVGGNYTGHKLEFTDGGFPSGTTIVLIDMTDSTPTYYYYNVASSDLTSIDLNSFVKMGGNTNYTDRAEGTDVTKKEKLLFIIDFGNSQLSAGSYTLSLKLIKNITQFDTIQNLTITATDSSSFSLSATATGEMVNSLSAAGNVTATLGSGIDSKYLYRKLALCVTLSDQNGNAQAFPDGAVISYNGTLYSPSGNDIIIPFGSIVNGTTAYQYELKTPHTMLTPGNYKLTTKLVVSATSNAQTPFGGEAVQPVSEISFEAKAKPVYGIRVDFTGTEGRLLKHSSSIEIPLSVYYNADTGSGVATVELQKKIGEIYVTVRDTISYMRTPSGAQNQPINGVVTSVNLNAQQSPIKPTLVLDGTKMKKGETYRLLIRVSGLGDTIEQPYNIVVAS